MSKVKIAFRKNSDGIYTQAICFFTRSKYHHCELIVDGISYSSSQKDGGVRAKKITFVPDRWDIVEIDADPRKVVHWFIDHNGQKYDWFGAFKIALPFLPNYGSKWFCSEACAAALDLKNPKWYTPGDLAEHFGLKRK